MRIRTLWMAIATGMLTLGIALPAAADTSGPTTATITVESGTLSISVPAAAGNIGNAPNEVGGTIISGPLGEVQVTDARSLGAGSGWVASVISTAFTPIPAAVGPALAAGLISYTAGPITKVGTATYTANDPLSLAGVSAAVTATGITGDNSATWNPTIHVAVPQGTIAAVYAGTITHSVL